MKTRILFSLFLRSWVISTENNDILINLENKTLRLNSDECLERLSTYTFYSMMI